MSKTLTSKQHDNMIQRIGNVPRYASSNQTALNTKIPGVYEIYFQNPITHEVTLTYVGQAVNLGRRYRNYNDMYRLEKEQGNSPTYKFILEKGRSNFWFKCTPVHDEKERDILEERLIKTLKPTHNATPNGQGGRPKGGEQNGTRY